MRYAFMPAILLAFAVTPLTQQPPITRTTTGVVIDVHVVDRDGKPVLDLSHDEFELSEDGKRQQIVSASLVHGGAVRALDSSSVGASDTGATSRPSDAGIAGNPLPDRTPSVTAILFDRLSPEMRPLAHRAAVTYLGSLSSPHDYAGVFLADARLVTFAGFTNERETLRAAVDRLGASAPTTVSPAAERAGYSRVQQLPVDPNQPVTPAAESGAGWMTALEREKFLKQLNPEGMLRRIELRMFETYQQFLSEFQGQASLAGLRSVIDSMSALPGRKSILYFTESLPITDRLKPKFEALIGEANRGNITVYPVDAAGLRVHSEEAKVGRNVGVAGAQGVGDADRGKGAWTKELEHQEQVLSSRPTAVLGRLAKDTGGFLLENTNDLGAGVARIHQERTTYYLLAYQPMNTAADGKFRRVSVKVKRPRVTVKARPGYVAATR